MKAAPLYGIVALALGMTASLFAQEDQRPLSPDDFAYGFQVEGGGSGPVRELSLPDEVYRIVYRSDLGDLRVFNGAGVVVPHEAGRMPASEAEPGLARQFPVFPVLEDPATGGGGRIRIVTDEQGAIIEATSAAGPVTEPRDSSERVTAYLVDLGVTPERPERLELTWEAPVERGFAATLDVASGDDLATWQTLVQGVTLADLSSGEAVLVNRTINLPATDDRYLRIEWPQVLQGVRLERVDIVFAATPEPVVRRTLTVPSVREVGEAGQEYLFDSDGYWPIDRVRLVYEQGNVVQSGRLFSRPSEDVDWRTRHSGTYYRLEQDGTDVSSEPAAIDMSPDRYWRFEPEGGQGAEGEAPVLEIGWIPHRLTFVAQGDPPFTIAFGSSVVEPAGQAVASLRELVDSADGQERVADLVSGARASEVFTLGGPSRLEPPEPPLPWRLWVLWTTLSAGVLVLAWMVWRLARQMTPASPG